MKRKVWIFFPQRVTYFPDNSEIPMVQTAVTIPVPQPPTAAASSPQPVPHFTDAINDLRHLTAALTAFHNCYDDLQAHISSVESAIDSQLKSRETEIASKPNHSELEELCLTMCSRGLRRYMVANLGQADKLREEVPAALRLAKTPAKFVFDSIGRFFLQGSKAYAKDGSMVSAREASVLTLECFLLAQCDAGKIDKDVKEETGKAATLWKKRLISEGGLSECSMIDARGLLMFIGCFGVTQGFKNQDYKDLISAGNVKKISGALQKSSFLMAKISEVIQSAVKAKLAINAVDIMLSLGIEDEFHPQSILISFLREDKEDWMKNKRLAQGSLIAMHEANKKHLSTLQSVIKCLERHNVDPSKFLPGWQIKNKIPNLEKDIAESDKIIREQILKRKADEAISPLFRDQELKRNRYADHQVTISPHQLAPHYDSQRGYLDSFRGHPLEPVHSPTGAANYPSFYREAETDTARQSDDHRAQHHDLHRDAPPYGERHYSYTGQPSVFELASLYRPSVALEEFPGLPSNSTIGGTNQVSNLYQFADSVVDSETYPRAAAPPAPLAFSGHHPTYLL